MIRFQVVRKLSMNIAFVQGVSENTDDVFNVNMNSI